MVEQQSSEPISSSSEQNEPLTESSSSSRDESSNNNVNIPTPNGSGDANGWPSPRMVGNELLLPFPNGQTFRIQVNNRNVQPGVTTPTGTVASQQNSSSSSVASSQQQQQQQQPESTSNNNTSTDNNQSPGFQTLQIQVPNQQSNNEDGTTTSSNHNVRRIHLQINQSVRTATTPSNSNNTATPGTSDSTNSNNSERRQETNQADPNRSNETNHTNSNRNRNHRPRAMNFVRQAGPGPIPIPPGMRHVHFPQPNRNMINVPPLLPQPLPLANQPTMSTHDSSSTAAASEATNDDCNDNGINKFDCPICYEIMEDPASCGQCSNRFCYKCIVQVGRQQNSKCPCCRCALRLSNITRDGNLQRQIQSADATSCNFCGLGRLKLQDLKTHEAICPAINVRCRYSSFGCSWTGPRKDLESHEETCSLHNVRGLVTQLRVQQHMVMQLQQVANNSNQMIELHNQNLARVQSSKSPGHLLHMLELAYVTTCIPARYLADRSTSWAHFERSREAKAMVHNFFTFLPTAILCIRIAANAFDQMLELENAKNGDHLLDLLLDQLLAYAITMLGAVAISCCFVEVQSSYEWHNHDRFRNIFGRPHPVIRDMVAISLLTVYFSVMDLLEGKNAILIWMLCLLSSVFFPAVVLTVVGSSDLNFVSIYHRTPTRIMRAGRAFPVVTFGLRYGFLGNLVGIGSCLDAIILYRLCLHYNILKRDYVLGMDCFISDLSSLNVWLMLGAARVSVEVGTAKFKNGDLLQNLCLPAIFAVVSLVVLIMEDRAISKLAEFGVTIGKTIHQAGRNALGPRNEPIIGREYNQVGMFVFGIWCATVGAIALAR